MAHPSSEPSVHLGQNGEVYFTQKFSREPYRVYDLWLDDARWQLENPPYPAATMRLFRAQDPRVPRRCYLFTTADSRDVRADLLDAQCHAAFTFDRIPGDRLQVPHSAPARRLSWDEHMQRHTARDEAIKENARRFPEEKA